MDGIKWKIRIQKSHKTKRGNRTHRNRVQAPSIPSPWAGAAPAPNLTVDDKTADDADDDADEDEDDGAGVASADHDAFRLRSLGK
jgi:hypothetical protein